MSGETFTLAGRPVHRVGFGAMQLPGPGVFGPPKDHGAPAVRETAERLGVTPVQVALAWLLALTPNVLLIPGTSSLAHLEENLAAAGVALDQSALDALDHVKAVDWGKHEG